MPIRWRELLAVLVVTLGPLAGGLAWVEGRVRPSLVHQAGSSLESLAVSLVAAAGEAPPTDSLADAMGSRTGMRVTFVRRDGRVTGDSEVPAYAIPRLEDHAARPEIRAAAEAGVGTSLRGSSTVDRELIYTAVAWDDGFLRLAAPADVVEAPLAEARRAVVLASLLVLVLLLIATGWSRRGLDRSVGVLATDVRALARRRPPASRIPATADRLLPDLVPIAAAVTEAARRLDEHDREIGRRLSRLESMLETIDDALAVAGPDQRVVRSNRGFARFIGVDDPVGRPIGSLFRHPAPREAVESALDGLEVRFETLLGDRTTEVHAYPLEGGAILRLRDLSPTRRLEGVRRDFVANVSHELKTPLTAIRGFAEPLADADVEPGVVSDFAGRIMANAERMQALVDDLLDLSKIESGAWTPTPRPVDPSAALSQAWARVEGAARNRSIELLSVVPDPSVRLRTDASALDQILTNLLDNAVRHAPDGDVVTATVLPTSDGGFVRFEIADEGPGIPSFARERVFERFFRVDTARSREAGGTGLGLSIVKHLVVAQGGSVGIDSTLGEGATVWFELPDA